MPQGGSITPASMLFITLAGYWLGPIYGILAGISKGLLDTITGAHIIHPIQYLLDYMLAFGMLGISGFFRKQKFGLQIGYVAGVLGRLLMVFLSGLVFFSDITGMGLVPAMIFSLTYNITYIGPEMIVTLIIISLPSMRHAIDMVTKTIVPPNDYILMRSNNKGSITPGARLATGTIIGIFGGLAFVLASYIARLEALTITHFTTGFNLFVEVTDRIPRMIERNTTHIAGLQIVGVLFLAIGVALMFSTLLPQSSALNNDDT